MNNAGFLVLMAFALDSNTQAAQYFKEYIVFVFRYRRVSQETNRQKQAASSVCFTLVPHFDLFLNPENSGDM
jgi:hypothetical protein